MGVCVLRKSDARPFSFIRQDIVFSAALLVLGEHTCISWYMCTIEMSLDRVI